MSPALATDEADNGGKSLSRHLSVRLNQDQPTMATELGGLQCLVQGHQVNQLPTFHLFRSISSSLPSPGSNVWQSYYAPIYSPPGRILALVSRWGLEPHIGRAEGWQPHHPPPSPISPIAPPFGAGFLPRLPSQVNIFFYLEEKLLLSIASSIVQLQQLRGLGRLAAHLPPSSSSTCRRRRRSGGSSLSSATLSNATLTLFGSL